MNRYTRPREPLPHNANGPLTLFPSLSFPTVVIGSQSCYFNQKHRRVERTIHCSATMVFRCLSGNAGFRPGERGPFLSGKGPKTIDVQPGLICGTDASLRKEDQLASLKQGLQNDQSVPPLGLSASVG